METRNNIEHYANALFSIWFDENFDEQKIITKNAKNIYFSLKQNYEIIEVLNSNILTKTERKKILSKIFEETLEETRVSLYLYNFLVILIENNFFGKVLEIFISFFEKIDTHQNFIFLRIFSPYWLDKQTLEKIEYIFSKKTDKNVRYENMIDKNLIGGIKICFGNEVYDYSIKGQLEQIKWNLKNHKEV